MDSLTFAPAGPTPRKPAVYYIALIADMAKWSDNRDMAELVLNLAYGMADVMQDEAIALS